MPKMRIEGVVGTIGGIVEGLKKARKESAPKIEKAVVDWTARVETDARAGLARPHWLLTKHISSKVKNYDDKKIWAMAGFKFNEKNNKRDPGYYGQFHEAGWAPTGHKVTAPDHFLRKAKQANKGQLEKDVEKILPGIMERVKEEIQKHRGN